MKLMFLQDFHMDAKGGGTYILRRLHKYAPEYGVEPFYVYDTNGEGLYESGEYPSTAFSTRRRQYRFGLGRLAGFATIAGFDSGARKQLQQIIADEQPDAFHLTAHGVSFPIMAKAAFETDEKKILRHPADFRVASFSLHQSHRCLCDDSQQAR